MWSSMEARTKSVENKEHIAQKKMNHKTGKRSFAKVFDDMKNTKIAERERELKTGDESNGQQDGILQDDIIDYEPSRVDLFTKCYAKSGRTSNAFVSQSLVWTTVKLKSMFDPLKFVAVGRVEGLEPTKLVGQKELGKNWCEVKVNVALELGEELIPFYEFTTIGEVVVKAIAWPINLVVMEDDW